MTTVLDALKQKVAAGIPARAAGISIRVNGIYCHKCLPSRVMLEIHVCDDDGEPLVNIGSFTLFNGDDARILDIDRGFDIRIS